MSSLKVAVRKFGPFEAALRRQFADFRRATGVRCDFHQEQLDLEPLYETMFGRGGLKRGEWDIGFVVTDWLRRGVRGGPLLALAPLLAAEPVPDYPAGWSPSLTRMQRIGGALYALALYLGPHGLEYCQEPLGDRA